MIAVENNIKKRSVVLLACIITFLISANDELRAQDTIPENILLYQRAIGGWPKNNKEKYIKVLSVAEKAEVEDERGRNDATIDNNATSSEIRFLLKQYKITGNKTYLSAAEKGIEYLLKAQYQTNGGWPQFYPDLSSYRYEITYNDNAMINAMKVLNDVVSRTNNFDVTNPSFIQPAKKAITHGIDCILKTQVRVKGKLTVWCAQYDTATLQPAKARAYELPSLSGNESVGIVEFLMQVPHPSPQIKQAVNAAINWFNESQIVGYEFIAEKDASSPKGFNRVLIPKQGSVIWARFYDLETNQPFFCGRDGIKKKDVKDIEYERRNGYAWYGIWPKDLIEKEYPKWVASNNQ
jgi:PelA/Pel-15E family pectate lyase